MIIKEFFTDKELACKCGCGEMPLPRAIERLYALRLLWNEPIIINSGARCKAYNKTIGGSADSYHVHQLAFDITVDDHRGREYDLIKIAMSCGFSGLGIKDNTFLHIDIRFPFAVWGYSK